VLIVLYPSAVESAEADQSLAAVVGRTPFEVRVWQRSRIPRVIAHPASLEEANALVAGLERAGLSVETLDEAAFRRESDALEVRLPMLDTAGIVAKDKNVRMDWASIATIVHSHTSASVARTTSDVEVRYSPKGGRYTETVEHTRTERLQGEVLYLFPEQGRPWLLSMDTLKYAALGVPLRPTHRENFDVLLERIRAAATRARYDDSLLHESPPTSETINVRGTDSPGHVGPGVLLNFTATLVHRRILGQRSPYRTPG